MRTPRKAKVPLEKQLCILAREFRATRDDQQRASIARQYAQAVKQLIDSNKWKRIPPLEDQLPDEWMPTAFFTHWSLRPPRWGTGKPTILLDGMDDFAILRALLPPRVADVCELVDTHARSNLASAVRTHMIKRDAPVAILLDTHTLDQTLIAEQVRSTQDLVRSIAGNTPFDIFCCIPEIETVFFEDGIDFQRLFPKFKRNFTQELARAQPKQQFAVLFEKGEGPNTLSGFLDHLTLAEVTRLQAKDPIGQLIAFVENNRTPALQSN